MHTATPNTFERRTPRWIEWLAFGLLVAGMAIAVSVALSGVVLLLASTAQANDAPTARPGCSRMICSHPVKMALYA